MEVARPQLALVVEQQVVHLPERPWAAAASEASAASCRVRMDVGEGKVAPDVVDVAEVGQQLAHDRLGPAAVRALEVAVLDHRDRGVGRPAEVVAVGIDRDGEVDERLRASEQRADPQSGGAACAVALKTSQVRAEAQSAALSTPSFASRRSRP